MKRRLLLVVVGWLFAGAALEMESAPIAAREAAKFTVHLVGY